MGGLLLAHAANIFVNICCSFDLLHKEIASRSLSTRSASSDTLSFFAQASAAA